MNNPFTGEVDEVYDSVLLNFPNTNKVFKTKTASLGDIEITFDIDREGKFINLEIEGLIAYLQNYAD